MSDVEKWIAQLSSSKAGMRYEACEELRVAESLPEHAFKALELAINDPDPRVADASRRALTTHRPPTQEPALQSPASNPLPEGQKKRAGGCLIAFVVVAIVGVILLGSICSSSGKGDWTQWESCMATEESFARDWGLSTNRAACERFKP